MEHLQETAEANRMTTVYSSTKVDKFVLRSVPMVSYTKQVCVFVYSGSPTDGEANGWEVVG